MLKLAGRWRGGNSLNVARNCPTMACERAKEDAQMFYAKWKADRAFLLVPARRL